MDQPGTSKEDNRQARRVDYYSKLEIEEIRSLLEKKYIGITRFLHDFKPDHKDCCSRKLRKPCPFFNKGNCYLEVEHMATWQDKRHGREIYGHFCLECYYILGLHLEHSALCPDCPLRRMARAETKYTK